MLNDPSLSPTPAPDDSDLTTRQREIYLFIREKVAGEGRPPTVREMCARFGINSPNGIMCHLNALEKKGYIVREKNAARAIRLVTPIESRRHEMYEPSPESLSVLTDRQRGVFRYVVQSIYERGYPPTVREIGEEFGISSPNGVMCHLKALESKGFIVREPNSSRGIRLVSSPLEFMTRSVSAKRITRSERLDSSSADQNRFAGELRSVPAGECVDLNMLAKQLSGLCD